MAQGLFRQEVVDHQQERHWGGCMGNNPVGLCVFAWLLVVLALICGAFLGLGDYQRKTVVTGALVADKGSIQVTAPADGMVAGLNTDLGKRVGQGERLLTLQTGLSQIGGEAVAGHLLAENRQQIALLAAQISDRHKEYPVRHKQLSAEQQSIGLRHKRLQEVLATQQAVSALMAQQHDRLLTLHGKSVVVASDVEKSRIELLKQNAVTLQVQLELNNTEKTMEAAGGKLELLALEHEREVNELESRLSELRTRTVQLQAEQGLEVIAPVTGTVSVVLLQDGQPVLAGQPVLSLMPEGAVLQAELHVPSRAIGLLREGDEVRMRFDAFPYQKFGLQAARIRSISRNVIMPAGSTAKANNAEPYYKVVATLATQSIAAYGDKFDLRPGMQFQADIVLEHRNLLEWLLEPLFINGRLAGAGS